MVLKPKNPEEIFWLTHYNRRVLRIYFKITINILKHKFPKIFEITLFSFKVHKKRLRDIFKSAIIRTRINSELTFHPTLLFLWSKNGSLQNWNSQTLITTLVALLTISRDWVFESKVVPKIQPLIMLDFSMEAK